MLEAIQDNRFDLILEKLQLSQKSKSTDTKEAFEVFTKAQSSKFWDFTLQNCKPIMERIMIRVGNNDTQDLLSKEAEEDLLNMKCVIQAIGTFYSVSQQGKPPAVFDILEISQDILTCTSSNHSIQTLKSSVAKLCEIWWLNNDEGAEHLISQLIMYLLITSLSIDGHEVEIKRLYAIRSGFLLLEFEDSSSSFLRDLIQRCFVHPAFLKCKEGQKLLAFLLNVNKGFLVDLVASVIRPQLATGVKHVAAAYGKVLYHAWKESQSSGEEDNSSDARENADRDSGKAIEDVVQNLLRGGVHAAEVKYFRGVRFLLQSFHDVQRNKLDAMLLRVYDPILWRSLRCANATVRGQAAVVFMDVFPLQQADGRAEENDKILQKQFDLLAALLTDADHQVRAHAALGVCHILKEYWESLPLNTTHNILKYLIDTLSCDASCANVRHAVFVGLGELFHQPLTHSLLKQLLPLLKNSIHDKAEKVRVAFINILCQIKSVRGMHFYEVVPVDDLLLRLAEDRGCPHVCRALVDLLLNSFYPQGEAGAETEQLNRCVQFIERNPVAAEAFYGNLHQCISIGHIAKLSTVMFTFLVTAARRASAQQRGSAELEESESGEADESTTGGKRRRAVKAAPMQLSFNVRLGVMRIVRRLLLSIEARLVAEDPSRELLCKYLTEEHAKTVLMFCAQSAPAEAVHLLPDAFSLVALTAMLRQMNASSGLTQQKGGKASKKVAPALISDLDVIVRDLFCPAWAAVDQECGRSALSDATVAMFCKANQQAELLSMISHSLEEVVGSTSTVKGKGKGENVFLMPLTCAVDLLSSCKDPVFLEGVAGQEMLSIFKMVQIMCDASMAGVAEEIPSAVVEKAVQSWVLHCLQVDAGAECARSSDDAENGPPKSCMMAEAVRWAAESVVPNTSAAAGVNNNTADRLLSIITAQASDSLYLDICVEAVSSALCDCFSALPKDQQASPVSAVVKRISVILRGAHNQQEGKEESTQVAALKAAIEGKSLDIVNGVDEAAGVQTGALEAQVWIST